jgi:molybdopterin-containing oxidoreductase family membrane subunit
MAVPVADKVVGLTLRRGVDSWWWWAFLPSLALTGLLVVAVGWLFAKGIGIWGNNHPVNWAFAIIAYVWWIAIASGGTFISAFFFLMKVDWRTALNRIAESMTLFAAACAGLYPILHLGRPWFAYWLIPYPDTMGLWPQFRSPLLWDFYALLTYVIASILFWYLGLIPDLAVVRDRAETRGKRWVYGILAAGFQGRGQQWRHYRAAYGVLAALMAPLVVSVHSIVGLDFAGGEVPGWHSTQFPPFFVFGAMLSGFATVLLLVIPLRRLLGLGAFITERHLEVLGRLTLTSSLCVGYAYVMDAFSTFYGGGEVERLQFIDRLTGAYWPVYWATILLNVTLPQALWWRRVRTDPAALMAISFLVVIGMWFERFNIIVTSLHHTAMPSAWGIYHPTFWDYATLFGTVGLFFSGFLLFVRFLPVISIAEMRQAQATGEPP